MQTPSLARRLGSIFYWFGIPIAGLVITSLLVTIAYGPQGLIGQLMARASVWQIVLAYMVMVHLTITAMSLCFHRMHTHQGVKLHPLIDWGMQLWLWCTTSMSKRDWVSVHVYHHTHSDQALDPHSPVQKGLAHVFFLGVGGYVRAKSQPDVLKIRKRIPLNALEAFIEKNLFLGPILYSFACLLLLGPVYGTVTALMTFLISPIFAVGGVNAIAHWWGYRNHKTTDNSRNVGFLWILNWMICGELDHNNHHAYPKSCSFRHQWYEFDIGYVYIRLLQAVGLAKPLVVYKRKRAPLVTSPMPAAATAHATEPALVEAVAETA